MKLTKIKLEARKDAKPDTITNDVLQFPEYVFGGQYSTGAERHYRGWYKGYEVWAILFTRRNGESWGKGKLSYYIENERAKYETTDDLMKELDKRTLKIIPR